MIISWLFLLLGGFCEVGFVMMMKLSDGFVKLKYSVCTVLFMIASFYSLSYALKEIPIGTGYAVWSGIGAVGSVIIGMLYFKETRSVLKIIFILMIILGIVGLKIASN
ncbi:MAG: hypothetical protein RL662_890 [Bacteroidota bacterium]|jgi:quaternary ammonium compound-resistance protein SugE